MKQGKVPLLFYQLLMEGMDMLSSKQDGGPFRNCLGVEGLERSCKLRWYETAVKILY